MVFPLLYTLQTSPGSVAAHKGFKQRWGGENEEFLEVSHPTGSPASICREEGWKNTTGSSTSWGPQHVPRSWSFITQKSITRRWFNRAPVVYWIYLFSGINKPIRIRPRLFKPPPTSKHPDPERHTMWDCCSPPARPFRTFQNKAWVSSNCALQQPGSRGNCWNGRCRPPAAGTDASTSTHSLGTETEIPRTGSSVWGERILLDQTVEVMLMMWL